MKIRFCVYGFFVLYPIYCYSLTEWKKKSFQKKFSCFESSPFNFLFWFFVCLRVKMKSILSCNKCCVEINYISLFLFFFFSISVVMCRHFFSYSFDFFFIRWIANVSYYSLTWFNLLFWSCETKSILMTKKMN